MPSKRQRRRMRRMSEAGRADDTSTEKDAKKLPSEVFDSSKYDAMSDMTRVSSTNQLSDRQAVMDVQKKEPLKPEGIDNKSIASMPGSSTAAKVNPMVAEERARTIREINEEETPTPDTQGEVYAVERYGTTWNEAAASQYFEMVNAGVELYAQFVKNATDVMDAWFRLWYPSRKE